MIISVKVTTKSKKESIFFDEATNTYLIKFNVLPVEGKANTKLIELLSDYFKVSKSCIRIKRGNTSKNKVVEIII